MAKRHLKRLASPKSWDILKKKNKFITGPNPGAHSKKLGTSITVVLRDMLRLCRNTKEVIVTLNHKEVLVDGKRIKDRRYNVGLMDIISIPESKKTYRLMIDQKGKLSAVDIKDSECNIKPCKVMGKRAIDKNRTQLNTLSGRNILVEKGSYNVGDTLLVEVPAQKISKHIKLEKGALVYLIGGRHTGEIGKVEDIEGKMIAVKTEDMVFETLRKYAFAIGKDKPEITISG